MSYLQFASFLSSEKQSPRLRLHYLDGLRALAAISVVIGHAQLQSNWYGGDSIWLHVQFLLVKAISNGRAAVALFIVLSGYCLMIPIARSGSEIMWGGIVSYFKRRARRILPPYYCALALILLTVFFVPGLGTTPVPQWHDAYPFFTSGAIIPHLLLIHNWKPNWIFKIDPPAWTVATEWQIYFVFPTVLLPLWRKFGNFGTILVAFCIGLVPYFIFHHGEGASPWFLGLFALGMAAASINFSEKHKGLQSRLPWGWYAVGLAITALMLNNLSLFPPFDHSIHGTLDSLPHYFWIIDSMVGLATACLLIFCTRSIVENSQTRRPIVLRFLENRFLVFIGTFSYSLYLIHDPVLAYICMQLQEHGLSKFQNFLALAMLGLPVSLMIAYLFHLAFEKRFMSGGTKKA